MNQVFGLIALVCGAAIAFTMLGQSDKSTAVAVSETSAVSIAIKDHPSLSEVEVCRAALSRHMGIALKELSVDRRSVNVTYRTPTDRARGGSGMHCQLLPNNRLMWRNADGRWRNHPNDETLHYRATMDRLLVASVSANGQTEWAEWFDTEALK